jgi:hypothetical protein
MDLVSNPNGYTPNLVPAHPGNQNRLVHGVYSERLREPRAQEIFEAIMAASHTVSLDAIAARNIARLEALIEGCHGEIERGGVSRGSKVRALVDLELRAIRRQVELLDRFGLNPQARAEWASKLAGGSLADEVRRRLAELEEPGA